MAKVTPAAQSAVQPQSNQQARPSKISTNFSDLLEQSRELASKLTIHKAAMHTHISNTMPLQPAANDDKESTEQPVQSLPEIGQSIATLMGKLSVLRATQKS